MPKARLATCCAPTGCPHALNYALAIVQLQDGIFCPHSLALPAPVVLMAESAPHGDELKGPLLFKFWKMPRCPVGSLHFSLTDNNLRQLSGTTHCANSWLLANSGLYEFGRTAHANAMFLF